MGYDEKYKESAQIETEADKARIIGKICQLLWADDDFYKAMVQYARSAVGRDAIG